MIPILCVLLCVLLCIITAMLGVALVPLYEICGDMGCHVCSNVVTWPVLSRSIADDTGAVIPVDGGLDM